MKVAALALIAAVVGSGTAGAAPAPAVAVSIKPVHSLVAAVMEGVGSPTLLVQGAADPHTYSLRPSEARALARARVVLWVGEDLETFLSKPLKALAGRAEVVELLDVPGMRLLPARAGAAWEDADGHRATEGGHRHGTTDGHLWLDPENAGRIADVAARTLIRVDPPNRARYEENLRKVKSRLKSLDAELAAALGPFRGIPYVVFHDAYQYLERRYGLGAVGSVTVSPDRRPGARRLSQLRQKIERLGARCAFSEPQFEPGLVATLVEGTTARTGTLDDVGAEVPPGPDAYFLVLRALAGSLAACLGNP